MFERAIRYNQFKTNCVIAIYILIFISIGLPMDALYVRTGTLSERFHSLLTFNHFPFMTLTLLGTSVLIIVITIYQFKRIVLSGNEYKEIIEGAEDNAQEKELNKILGELVETAKLSFCPKLYLMEAPFMNAFASGWKKNNSLIAVTTTLVENLSCEELKAVIAHELSHIRHGDIRLTLMAAVLSNVVLFGVKRAITRIHRRNSNAENADKAMMILMLLRFTLPVFTLILQMFLSRSREYMADSGAAL